jgi:tetratricopeptide (TPR) repeat protein
VRAVIGDRLWTHSMTQSTRAVVELAHQLVRDGQAAAAIAAIESAGRRADAGLPELDAYVLALKSAGRLEEAADVCRRAIAIAPWNAVAEYNLAAIEQRLGRDEEAAEAIQRSFDKGFDAPEAWACLARALQGLDRNDEAEEAYREALQRSANMPDVHRDLAQLIWMRTGSVEAATAELRKAVERFPGEAGKGLSVQLAKALRYADQNEDAYAVLQKQIDKSKGAVPELETAAANAAGKLGKWTEALYHGERAFAAAPQNPASVLALCDIYVATGRHETAMRILEQMHRQLPNAQQVAARLATAWRIAGNPNYRSLYDYEAYVRSYRLGFPPDCSTLEAYLGELALALRSKHTMNTHPFDQSLRHGTQTYADLTSSDDRRIKQFFEVIDRPIREYIDMLGDGDGQFHRRKTGGYAIHSAWSVRLKASGFHVNHVHQYGWLSGVCYIDVPSAIQKDGNEGWLKLGEPGIATNPSLGAEYMVKPEAGHLVLFPAYMWHGTVPFTGEDERLTIAFDVIPA